MVSKKLVLIIVLSVLFLLLGILTITGFLRFLISPVQLSSSIALLVILVIFLTIIFLFLGLIENRKIIYLISLLLIIVLSLIGYKYFNRNGFVWYLIGLIVFYALLTISFEVISAEKELYRKVSLVRAWRRGVPLIITALAILLSIIYYFHPLLKFENNKIELPPQLIKWSIGPIAPLLSRLLPFYDPNKTIDEVLSMTLLANQDRSNLDFIGLDAKTLEQFIDKKTGRINFDEIAKNQEINQLVQGQLFKQAKNIDSRLIIQQRNELGKSLGITLTGKEKMDDVLSKIIDSQVGSLIGPYGKIISYFITLIIFFALRFIFSLLAAISLLLTRIVFNLLRLMKVVRIEKQMAEVEIIKI